MFTIDDLGRSDKQKAIVARRAKVLKLQSSGCSTAEIARRLKISYKQARKDVKANRR